MTIAVLRYLRDGHLDPAFGVGGIVRMNFPYPESEVFAMKVYPGDRIVMIGGCQNNLLVASLLEDGSANKTYSPEGKSSVFFPFLPRDAVVEPRQQVVVPRAASAGRAGLDPQIGAFGDRIVASGGVTSGATGRFSVARYSPFDRIDTTFGANNGFVLTDFLAEGIAMATSVGVDRHGRIVAAGLVNEFNSELHHFAVARYRADG